MFTQHSLNTTTDSAPSAEATNQGPVNRPPSSKTVTETGVLGQAYGMVLIKTTAGDTTNKPCRSNPHLCRLL